MANSVVRQVRGRRLAQRRAFVVVSFGLVLCSISLSAQPKHTHTTFTPSSAIFQQDPNTWYIGAEAVLAPPAGGTWLTDADLKFSLPPNGTITRVEATVSFASPWGPTSNICPQPNEALGMLIIDGKKIPIIQKLNSSLNAGSREITTFVRYDIPIKYTEGVGTLHVEANPFGCWSDWEIQGIVRIEF